ncbi:MAG TPA: hypothetical protein PKJ37_00045 [Acidobacteriota bacterium]|nr:hypothetical protein [Acidobacteriota bacterium]
MKKKCRVFSFGVLVLLTTAVFPQAGDKLGSGDLRGQAVGLNRGGGIRHGFGKATAETSQAPGAADTVTVPGGISGAPLEAGRQEMIDLTTLYVAKSEDGTVLYLSWNYDDPLFNVFKCYEPSFQNGVATLGKELAVDSLEVAANVSKTLECFEVAGASVASAATQGMGYDPEPSPTVPTTEDVGLWWGDEVTLSANYLDLIPKGNIAYMGDLPVRADEVPTYSGSYGTSAKFTIPDDARGFYPFVQAGGRSSDTGGTYQFVPLYARGVGPYTAINGISYAPQTGRIWVAATGVVQEVDLFLHDPEPSTTKYYADAAVPYISRVTTDGRILYVDGTNGVTTVWQVNVTSGARSEYAKTTDTGFTTLITPVGIAVDPDGGSCYIADGSRGKVVKIPAGSGSGTTIKDNWGNRTYSFPVPCGMDVNVGSTRIAIVADANGTIYYITGQNYTYVYGSPGSSVHAIQVDRDYALSSFAPIFWSNELAMTEAFNINPIGSDEAANHGGVVFGTEAGYVALEPHKAFNTYRHYPQRVILNNSGQGIGYPSSYQSADRIVQLRVVGWANRPLKLRLIDPPDLSPYAPDDGCLQGGCTPCLPYEANDNIGNTDYGICALPDCSDGANVTKTLYCDSNGSLTYYLKVPERYSGDNFQVEVQKTDYYGNNLPETRVAMCSSVYTSWKRVFVERDKMFRRGGILAADFNKATCGSNCNQIKLYNWANVVIDDVIVVFDELSPFETKGEVKVIAADPVDNADGTITVTLDSNLTADCYYASTFTGTPPNIAPDFGNGHAAGVGVIHSADLEIYDTASNQINGPGSAFYETDMRDIEKTYNDAYVEFYGLRSGMNAVPHIDPQMPFYTVNETPGDDETNRLNFHQIWWKNNTYNWNYFHLVGCRGDDFVWTGSTTGITDPSNDDSYIYRWTVEGLGENQSYTPEQVNLVTQALTNHELAHQFWLNRCSNLTCGSDTNLGKHDDRPWWNFTTTGCPNDNPCLMDWKGGNLIDEFNRFCKEDLFLGDPNCGSTIKPDSAIRTISDPIP